jgi:hypothetical protein
VYNPSPPLTQEQYAASLGGGHVQPVALPIDVRVVVRDPSGALLPFPDSVANLPIQVSLTVQANPSQGTFTWLREMQLYGYFAGFVRDPSSFDAAQNALLLQVPARELNGALFLPTVLQPWWVQATDTNLHLWSGPTVDAIDLGPVGGLLVLPVMGPQALGRIYVNDPTLGISGWVDTKGVAPSGPPGPPTSVPPPAPSDDSEDDTVT